MARWIKDEDGNKVPGYFEYCGGRTPMHLHRFPSDKPSMRRHDLGTCPHCYKVLHLKADGTLQTHGRYVS